MKFREAQGESGSLSHSPQYTNKSVVLQDLTGASGSEIAAFKKVIYSRYLIAGYGGAHL